MQIRIEHIEYYLPEKTVTNADLEKENPQWEMDKVEEKSGVASRQIAADNETAFDLSVKACEKLFRYFDKSKTGGIIFCTQSPDYIMPSNAFLIQKHFGLPVQIPVFDISLACSGFVYALALAGSMIGSGLASNILLINADTYSKFIHKKDRSARVLFGDGAAVSLITPSTGDSHITGISLASSGQHFESFYIPAGGFRQPKNSFTSAEKEDSSGNIRSAENIHMNGLAVWSFIQSSVPKQILELLDRHEKRLQDIDLFFFHQASRMTLDSLVRKMEIDPQKVPGNLKQTGNTVSASIPILMKDSMEQGILKRGQTILISGFGVGLSWGSMIIKF
jgi:3-oxoacyl-[acyl-carrier-protein] synthase III